MRATAKLLLSAGIDPSQAPAEALALCFRSMALRKSVGETPATMETIFERAFFTSLEECRQALDLFGEAPPKEGKAFGISWPWLDISDALVAPALPLRLRQTEEEGPDGIYRTDHNNILRESAGEERNFLDCSHPGTPDEFPFDLLCFGPMERYLLRNGLLEIEDLFCRARLRVSMPELEKLLVRSMRRNPALIEGLSLREAGEKPEPGARLSISRPADPCFLDPIAFFRVRADVRELSISGPKLEVRSLRDEHAIFRITEDRDGWCAKLLEGSYQFHHIDMSLRNNRMYLEVQPSAEIHLLEPGKRGRLAFDLHSDCVMLRQNNRN